MNRFRKPAYFASPFRKKKKNLSLVYFLNTLRSSLKGNIPQGKFGCFNASVEIKLCSRKIKMEKTGSLI